ncbi:hypothetical protein ATK36_0889 [Amycolatopsis sulphurea]|uniref:Uncharacterized protein n=1 Tax=Amycolatopsis sulphurea TaxID=76022 RepID=A0A2A9G3J9_9PSEU|nr:hypothetical protein ATK36_0889 [Amycolatopsis sulphurea]
MRIDHQTSTEYLHPPPRHSSPGADWPAPQATEKPPAAGPTAPTVKNPHQRTPPRPPHPAVPPTSGRYRAAPRTRRPALGSCQRTRTRHRPPGRRHEAAAVEQLTASREAPPGRRGRQAGRRHAPLSGLGSAGSRQPRRSPRVCPAGPGDSRSGTRPTRPGLRRSPARRHPPHPRRPRDRTHTPGPRCRLPRHLGRPSAARKVPTQPRPPPDRSRRPASHPHSMGKRMGGPDPNRRTRGSNGPCVAERVSSAPRARARATGGAGLASNWAAPKRLPRSRPDCCTNRCPGQTAGSTFGTRLIALLNQHRADTTAGDRPPITRLTILPGHHT